MIDAETWPLMCDYFTSDRKQKQALQNKENRKSQKKGRPTYTGGLRNIIRATEKVRQDVVSAGGTPNVLHEYVATHSTTTDPVFDTLTYPDAGTEEYMEWVRREASATGVDY